MSVRLLFILAVASLSSTLTFAGCDTPGLPEEIKRVCEIRSKLTDGKKSVVYFHSTSSVANNLLPSATFELVKQEFPELSFFKANVKTGLEISKYLPHRNFDWNGKFASASIGIFDEDSYLIHKFPVYHNDSVRDLVNAISGFLQNVDLFMTSRSAFRGLVSNHKNLLVIYIRGYSNSFINLKEALEDLESNGSLPGASNIKVAIVPLNSNAATLYTGHSNNAIRSYNMAGYALYQSARKISQFKQISYKASPYAIARDIQNEIYLALSDRL